MTTEVKVPALPESVSDGVVACWHKQPGDVIRRDEALVDIETDKVVLEIPAPKDGVLEKILFTDGDIVTADQVIGLIGTNGSGRQATNAADSTPLEPETDNGDEQQKQPGPAARKLIADHDLDFRQITATGRQGQITKSDVLAHVESLQPARVVAKQSLGGKSKPFFNEFISPIQACE